MTIAELRRARMARGLSLTEISRRTRIGVGHLRKIDDGDLQGLPERVLAPQRGLASIGPVLREWLLLINGIRYKIDQIL